MAGRRCCPHGGAPCLLSRRPACCYYLALAGSPFQSVHACLPMPTIPLQARAQAVEARHAAGADGEFLETKKNT